MAQERYDHQGVELKWQKSWYASAAFAAAEHPAKPKAYILDMFPYPSGDGLHVGHPEGYTASDIFSRCLRMQGKDVLHPMGWDAFGLPAENYAIKTGTHPSDTTKQNIATFKRQIQSLGFSYDWSREVNTTDPGYYKWTQWIFLKLFEHGLAYEAEAPINWCPKDKTGLANEEVVGGKCDRCGTVVEKKNIRQWLVKITDAKYIERLLNDLDSLDWPESIKQSQRNWIGKSEGATVQFETNDAPHYVILHGFTGSPQENFLPWLKSQLEARGAKVDVPALPETENPDVMGQVKYVQKHVELTSNTVIVAHSLGVAVALKVLEQSKVQIAALVSAGGFLAPKFKDHNRPFAPSFPKTFNNAAIRKHVREIRILRAAEDYAVPEAQAEALRDAIGGKIVDVVTKEPHFLGSEEPSLLEACSTNVNVFTTRPDTLFGATYIVLSPEHPLVGKITTGKQWKAVEKYQKQASQKSDIDRTDLAKEKTGVFTGAYAINPVNSEKIPIWIADYVLSTYGTGAIMAVPAHDDRDYAFAKKYDLPIVPVIAPHVIDEKNPPQAGKPTVPRKGIQALIYNPKTKKYLTLKWKHQPWQTFVVGGVEGDEDIVEAAKREILEETGYADVHLERVMGGPVLAEYFAAHKGENRQALAYPILFTLTSDRREPVSADEQDKHEVVWLTLDEIRTQDMACSELPIWLERLKGNEVYSGDGVMVNSGEHAGKNSIVFKKDIIRWLEQQGKGKAATNYKLRDWVFSRQRYWGEPIPIVHCEQCKHDVLTKSHELHFYDQQSWEKIMSGQKTVESRALNPKEQERYFGNIGVGEYLKLQNMATHEDVFFEVTGAHTYKKLGDFLADREVFGKMAPNKEYKSEAELEEAYAFTPEYVEKIRKNGLVAWEITRVQPGLVGVPASQLPITLPDVEKYEPTGTGESPLANIKDWVNTTCPKCGGPAKRETNTMPQWAGSNWYFLRYCDPHNGKQLADPEKLKAWLPVDTYIGGAEHAVLHLLYARFIYKFLHDIGAVPNELPDEPFTKLINQGLILAEDGQKMSKSRGNVINPDLVVREYGADALRMFEMFMGPLEDAKPWSTRGIVGVRRFLEKVWQLQDKVQGGAGLHRETHGLVKQIGEDIASFSLNTAVSNFMKWTNTAMTWESVSEAEFGVFLTLLSPFAPHLAQELWSQLGHTDQVHAQPWPTFDATKVAAESVEVVVQVNGKVRDKFTVASGTSDAELQAKALASGKVQKWLDGKTPKKVIVVKSKLVSIVL